MEKGEKVKKRRKSKTFSIKTLYKTKFKKWGFDGLLKEVLGDVEGKSFTAHIYGNSGHGKSRLLMSIVKELAKYGKVFFNQTESGKSSVFKSLCKDFDISEDAPISGGDRMDYEEMVEACKRNRSMFIVIDSSDKMKLTEDQWMRLVETFLNKKSIITIGHAEPSGKTPAGYNGKKIEYYSDIKIMVHQGMADIQSRFGAKPSYKIPGVYERWQDKLMERAKRKKDLEAKAQEGNIGGLTQQSTVAEDLKKKLQGASPVLEE